MPFIFAIAEIASQQRSWRLYGASPLTHSLSSLSQRSTCNLALSAKKRPYRSFTHHPRKTTFFKRLVKSMGAIHSAQSVRRFLLTNTSSDLFIPIVALWRLAPSVFRQLFFDGVSPPSPRSLDCSEKEFHTPEITRLSRPGRGIFRLLRDFGLER